uniref:FLYWCH-type domain-containing protein n=1 Tax=Glossina austeni TaxID=7395 RepID=A0A1A9VHY5_GLOAU
MKIFIPNSCIYTSRLSELVFGVEILEKVARSAHKDRLKLLDNDLLQSIINIKYIFEDKNTTTYIQYSTTQRGRVMLIYNGYRYVENRQSHKNIFWRCSRYVKYGCRATVVTSKVNDDVSIRVAGSPHTHEPELKTDSLVDMTPNSLIRRNKAVANRKLESFRRPFNLPKILDGKFYNNIQENQKTPGGIHATCTSCYGIISGTTKSTGNFLSHIKRRHKDILASCQLYCSAKGLTDSKLALALNLPSLPTSIRILKKPQNVIPATQVLPALRTYSSIRCDPSSPQNSNNNDNTSEHSPNGIFKTSSIH